MLVMNNSKVLSQWQTGREKALFSPGHIQEEVFAGQRKGAWNCEEFLWIWRTSGESDASPSFLPSLRYRKWISCLPDPQFCLPTLGRFIPLHRNHRLNLSLHQLNRVISQLQTPPDCFWLFFVESQVSIQRGFWILVRQLLEELLSTYYCVFLFLFRFSIFRNEAHCSCERKSFIKCHDFSFKASSVLHYTFVLGFEIMLGQLVWWAANFTWSDSYTVSCFVFLEIMPFAFYFSVFAGYELQSALSLTLGFVAEVQGQWWESMI